MGLFIMAIPLRCFTKEDGSIDFEKASNKFFHSSTRYILPINTPQELQDKFWKGLHNYQKWNVPEIKEQRHQEAICLWEQRKRERKTNILSVIKRKLKFI